MAPLSCCKAALLAILLCPWHVTSKPTEPPIVKLVQGSYQGITANNVTQYLGIPFAQPPIGRLRFRRPLPLQARNSGLHNATQFAAACPQQTLSPIPFFVQTNYSSVSEDCLTISIVKPAAVKQSDKLPVLFWIYGGAFEIGAAQDGPMLPVVARSIMIDQPVIVVAPNYRLNGFGFLGGVQVQNAKVSNLGLYDQILALKWVQENIGAFGGDPRKVVIGGPSAGAVSVMSHLLINAGKTPTTFRGAFMESGFTIPSGSIGESQASYDQIVRDTNCAQSRDTLDCLRQAPFDSLMSAINKNKNIFSYTSLNNEFRPRIDGDLIKESQLLTATKSRFARVPLIAGTSDDEGSLFALSSTNVTTDDAFRQYISMLYLPNTTTTEMDSVAKLYSDNPAFGCPFDTGNNSAFTPQYKRIAAVTGDMIYSYPRRLLLQQASKQQDAWSYIYKRGKTTSPLGASHGSDGPEWFGLLNTTNYVGADAFIRFINTLNPNVRSDGQNSPPEFMWPKYGTSKSGSLLTFFDPVNVTLSEDTYRPDGISLLGKLQLQGLNGPPRTPHTDFHETLHVLKLV